MIRAIQETKGMLFLAAQRVGCSYRTIYNYVEKYPEVREALDNERGVLNDVAESKLAIAIYNGEAWAIQFQLRMQAKDRGYVGRQEIANPEGQAFMVRVDR
jgi:hypothetical protein